MEGGSQKVWVSDHVHGFILGHITDISSDGVTVQPIAKNSKPIVCDYDRTYPAEDNDTKHVDDNCE